jgi:hypothetical protein
MNSETTLSEVAAPYSCFSAAKKRYIVATAAGAGLFSSLSAQIYFPALNTLADDLNVSTSLINLTVTSYMVSKCTSNNVDHLLMDGCMLDLSRNCAYVHWRFCG